MDKSTNDSNWLGDYFARETAEREAAAITMDMGLEYIRTMPREELARIALKAAEGKPPTPELRGFRRADLVIEATDGETVQYVVVEASLTGKSRDARRAIRNASMLTEFTGLPARAAVASEKKDASIERQIASSAIHWHEIELDR